MTTNAGIKTEQQPDFYYLNDHVACEMFMHEARAAQVGGTLLVTVKRSAAGLTLRHLHGADVMLDCYHHPVSGQYPYERKRITYHPLSGCMCVQFALSMGAKRIDLYGFDGYSDGGRLESKNQMQRDVVQAMVAACPEVEFVFHGQPRYAVDGPNVRVLNLSC